MGHEKDERSLKRALLRPLFLLGVVLWSLVAPSCPAQLFTNLQSLVHQLPVNNLANPFDGPKGIGSADFDGDGQADIAVSNTDGSVTVFFGLGQGRFGPPIHLQTGVTSLRGIVCADLDADGFPDIAVADPYSGKIFLFFNQGSRVFAPPLELPAWRGVRNLVAADLDGDGLMDLVAGGPNTGVRQYRNLGDGSFTVMTNFSSLSFLSDDPSKFPKPVYSMKVFRADGASRDQLIVTHAETNRVWLLAPNAGGTLEIRGSLSTRFNSHALNVGQILSRTNNSRQDLVTVQRDAGTIEIHAASTNSASGFEQAIRQTINVPGGPRAVEIVDLNGDGWNDLLVVQRNFDSVLPYINSNGVLYATSEHPVGNSPREMVSHRFDDDAYPDLAVMNRGSSDISILLAYPQQVGFRGIDHLYLVDGNVVGLAVFDFNGDGRDDVIQLHRASGEFSVRLANPNGTLRPPVFYTVGNIPAAQVFADVNNDRIPDQITSNLGNTASLGTTNEKSSVSVRLGNGDGTFGPEQRFFLDNKVEGRLFALVPGDFDKDGNIDLAAGFLDSRIALFKGNGAGSFTYMRAHTFVDQARGLVAADFDGDGYLDLAGVGVSGEMWVIKNEGDLLDRPTLNPQKYLPPVGDSFGARTIIALSNQISGRLDLVLGTGKGAWRYLAGPGTTFLTPPIQLAGTAQSVSDMLFKDLDGNGSDELVISCREQDCLSVFARAPNGAYTFARFFDAPASRFIASGDLDGDGKPDLIGTGGFLWTALSSQTNHDSPPLTLLGQRRGLTNVVINELLAINTELPVDLDGDRVEDWVELYNGTSAGIQMTGWRLRSIAPDSSGKAQTNEFHFPPGFYFSPGTHRLIYFSEGTNYHTGFGLPGNEGSLVLLNASGVEIDRVNYPPQEENVSYARFKDGLQSFVFNQFPSPGRANAVNGLVDPIVTFRGVDPASFRPGQTNRIYVHAQDEVGISSITMVYELLQDPQDPSSRPRLQLYDDGLYGDGGVSDGLFAGELPSSLFEGADIQFYFEVVNLNDQVVQVPEDPTFGIFPDQPGNLFQLGIQPQLPLELSEVVAFNQNGLIDELGGTPDWVEVRNISSARLPLAGIGLAHQIGENSRYYFPTGVVLQPGQHFVVYCDDNSAQGPLHAPFHLSSSGDTIMLTGTTPNNSPTLLDWVQFPSMFPDEAYSRLGAGGNWRKSTPTPRSCNVAATWIGLLESNRVSFAFATVTNVTYSIEHTTGLEPPVHWTNKQTIPGDGIEHVVSEPLANAGFFRIRREN